MTRSLAPTPLTFIAQLDLATLPLTDELPRTGSLLFFYDAKNQPWGFDPRDRGSTVVLHVGGEQSLSRSSSPHDMAPELQSHFCALSASLEATLPDSPHELHGDRNATHSYGDLLAELAGASDDTTLHRACGWPQPIQSDVMALEAQLVTNGIYCGDAAGYQSPQAQGLRGGAADWTMLLQIDSDERGPGWMWGDSGRLYFWIKKDDLRERRFDRTWTILQCF